MKIYTNNLQYVYQVGSVALSDANMEALRSTDDNFEERQNHWIQTCINLQQVGLQKEYLHESNLHHNNSPQEPIS